MKKILGLTVAAFLVIGLVGGGTWAYFSDTEESTGNVFSSSTLDLGVANSGGTNPTGSVSATFGAADLAPGSAAGSGTLYVNNEGSIDMMMVTVEFSEVNFIDAMLDTVDGWDDTDDTDDLRQMIIATTVEWDGSAVSALEGESIGDIMIMGAVELGSLDADEELDLYIEWTFDATATNGCQGDEIELSIDLTGYQNY
jgi:predicted ribosomally synthesized peptide with SipW-like signal peptide